MVTTGRTYLSETTTDRLIPEARRRSPLVHTQHISTRIVKIAVTLSNSFQSGNREHLACCTPGKSACKSVEYLNMPGNSISSVGRRSNKGNSNSAWRVIKANHRITGDSQKLVSGDRIMLTARRHRVHGHLTFPNCLAISNENAASDTNTCLIPGSYGIVI